CLRDVIEIPIAGSRSSLCNDDHVISPTVVSSDENVCLNFTTPMGFMETDTVCVVTCDAQNADLCDTTIVIISPPTITVQPQIDTIRREVMAGMMQQICINSVLQLPNGAGESTLCNDDHSTAPTITNSGGTVCVNLLIPTDFMVSDTICVLTCDNQQTDICDTTIIIVTPEMINEVPLPDTIRLTTPLETAIDFCYDGFILPADEVNVTLCGEASNGTVSISEEEPCITYFPNLDFIGMDEFCVSFCDANDPMNCDTTYVLIDVRPRTDTITIVVDNTDPIDTCLTEVLELLGDVATASICDMNADEVMVTLQDSCVTIDPVDDFTGTTEICVVICDDNDPVVCDTTQIIVTVNPADCTEDIFFMDTMTLPNENGAGELCVPLAFNESSAYDVTIDGVEYTQSFGRCDVDSTVVYFYGNIAMADTLRISSWSVNNEIFTDTVANGINDLLAFLNENDPSEMWSIDTITNTISTTNNAENVYGNLVITPNTTNEEVTLNPGEFTVANGFTIIVTGAGMHEVVVTNTSTGCSDALTVTVEGEVEEPCDVFVASPLNLTTENCMDVFTVCLSDTLLNFNNYDFIVNGEEYTGELGNCSETMMTRYIYTTVPDLANVGPYTVDRWSVNGEENTGTFNNLAGLLAFMNGIDPTGNWTADFQNFSIIGGTAGNTYGDLMITQDATTATATLTPTTQFMPVGVSVDLPVGTYFFELVGADGCKDELAVNITCPDSPPFADTTLNVTLPMGGMETICVRDVIGINNGDIATIENTCPNESGTNSTVTIDETTYCIDITGIMEGMEMACIEVCNENGDCVTITINITVTNETECIDIIADEIAGMGVSCLDNQTEGELCINVPLMRFADLDIEVNGVAYNGTLLGCNVDSTFTYSYFTLLSLGDGPYSVDSWMVNGEMFSGAFTSIGDLVDSMNTWD
ncbi:MAG: hypothetical protein AB8G22_12665, partial [Saprospiraceae bacterium]